MPFSNMAWIGQPEQIEGTLLQRRRGRDHFERLGGAVLGLQCVLGEGGQVLEQGLEAVDRRAVGGELGVRLSFGLLGA